LKNKILIILTLFLGVSWGCEDLEVKDLNNKGLRDLYEDPDLYPTYVEGAAFDFWKATEWSWPTMALSSAAQIISSSWLNHGTKDMNQFPRKAFVNSVVYANKSINEKPWQHLNAGIVKVNDIFKIVKNDMGGQIIHSNGADITNRIKANGYFSRGICLGNLGLLYDKAFIVRTDTDIKELVVSSFDKVIDAAIEDLEEAIKICENDKTIVNEGFNGVTLTASQIIELAYSYIAKFEATQARDANDVKNLVDWQKVKTCAEKGLSYDFNVQGGGAWWSRMLERGQRNTACLISQRIIKMMNPSKTNEEVPYPWPNGVSTLPKIENPDDNRLNTDFKYFAKIRFKPSRGYYFYSSYAYERYQDYNASGSPLVPIFSTAENELLLAEATIRTGGSKAAAAEIINKTRVTRGAMEPFTGSESDDILLRAITYERLVELSFQGFANGFFYRRITTADDLKLAPGQFLHLPIPAYELEIIGEEIYTFGGDAVR